MPAAAGCRKDSLGLAEPISGLGSGSGRFSIEFDVLGFRGLGSRVFVEFRVEALAFLGGVGLV